jgi:phage I-like protein
MPTINDLHLDKEFLTVPYPGIPTSATKDVDACVTALIDDDDFEPVDPKQSKKQAAIAVCIAQIKHNLEMNKQFIGHTVVDVVEAAEEAGALPTHIKVLPVGTANTIKYGKIKVTEDDVDGMIENFDEGIRGGIPVDIDHPDGVTKKTEAAGWVKQLVNKGKEGLWAVVEWTKLGKELVGEKIYRFLSPEFTFNYKDSETSEEHGPALIAVSLTNRPMFQRSLPALTASEESDKNKVLLTFKEDSMAKRKSKKILADEEVKEESAPASEEKPVDEKPVDASPDESKEESKPKEVPEGEKEEEEKPASPSKPVSDDKKEEAAEKESAPSDSEKEEKPEAPVVEEKPEVEKEEAASESASESKSQTVIEAVDKIDRVDTLKAAELKAMEERAIKAEETLRRMEIEKEVTSSYLLSESGGKFAPRAKSALVDLILSMSETQLSSFKKVVDAIPGKKIFGEIGSSTNAPLKGSEQVNRLVSEKVAASKKEGARPKDAVTAFIEVAEENPDLLKG